MKGVSVLTVIEMRTNQWIGWMCGIVVLTELVSPLKSYAQPRQTYQVQQLYQELAKAIAQKNYAYALTVLDELSNEQPERRQELQAYRNQVQQLILSLIPPATPVPNSSKEIFAAQLAKHLNTIGASIYGAYWCPQTTKQLDEFKGNTLNYIECYPQKNKYLDPACSEIPGYPTWMINGKLYSGRYSLEQLAEVSGFKK